MRLEMGGSSNRLNQENAKPRRGRPGSGRERLLEAAVKTFARNGYRKTTLDEIASEARIANGTFYNHFRDKEDLYLQACAYAMFKWQEQINKEVSKKNAPEKFYALGREAFAYLLEHPELRMLMQHDP